MRMGVFVDPPALERLAELPVGGPRFLLTFDDGYPNNLRLGLPVLEDLRVPAVFFLSTHHLLSGEVFWFDRLVTPLQATGVTCLDLRQFGLREYRFAVGHDDRRWTGIQDLLNDVKRLGHPDSPAVLQVLDHVEALYGQWSVAPGNRLRPLNVQELRQMAQSRLCFFGSHGHRHQILTELEDTALARSLHHSKHVLEGLLGVTIGHFAYPNGSYDDRVVRACVQAGYQRAYAASPGLLTPRTDRFRIPRLLVGGYDSPDMVAARVNTLLLTRGLAERL
jgi:peptidoglycan/xylan/chitin deacetylase (PgdA/CDA1 family)